MVLKSHESGMSELVKWIGPYNPNESCPQLLQGDVLFYAKCIVGPLTLSVGDYVLVSNGMMNGSLAKICYKPRQKYVKKQQKLKTTCFFHFS